MCDTRRNGFYLLKDQQMIIIILRLIKEREKEREKEIIKIHRDINFLSFQLIILKIATRKISRKIN